MGVLCIVKWCVAISVANSNAAVVKNGISDEEDEMYVLVSRIEICGYRAKET
jgi:hypothetical protein